MRIRRPNLQSPTTILVVGWSAGCIAAQGTAWHSWEFLLGTAFFAVAYIFAWIAERGDGWL